jgi:YVTN family beta-propeller protein
VGSHHVTVLDGDSQETHSITTGSNPIVAVDEVHNRIYAVNLGDTFSISNTVTVIDGANEKTQNLVVGSQPAGIAVDPSRNRAWVTNLGGVDPPGVSVIEKSAHFAVFHIALDHHSIPLEVAINPTTNKVFVALRESPRLIEIDGSTFEQRSIPIGVAPASRIAVDHVHNTIYALQGSAETLTVINGESFETQTVPVGRDPIDVVVDADRDTAYVSNSGDGTITVVEGAEAPCFRCPRVVPFRPAESPSSLGHAELSSGVNPDSLNRE